MTFKALAVAVGFTFASVAGATAATLDFEFSFSDGTNTFFGLVKGLEDDATSAATQVEVTSGTWGVGAGVFTQSIGQNNLFEVAGGEVISADYIGSNAIWGSVFLTELSGTTRSLVTIPGTFGGTVSGPATYTAVSAVPLPASSLLLMSGIGGAAALKRRKKRAA